MGYRCRCQCAVGVRVVALGRASVLTQVLRRPGLPLVGGDCRFATIRAAEFQGYRKQSSLVTQPAASSRNTAAQGSARYLGSVETTGLCYQFNRRGPGPGGMFRVSGDR